MECIEGAGDAPLFMDALSYDGVPILAGWSISLARGLGVATIRPLWALFELCEEDTEETLGL